MTLHKKATTNKATKKQTKSTWWGHMDLKKKPEAPPPQKPGHGPWKKWYVGPGVYFWTSVPIGFNPWLDDSDSDDSDDEQE